MHMNPGEGYNPDQKTFILMWNPAFSSVTMDDYLYCIENFDEVTFNWSVYEWEKAHDGDRFYLVRVGEGKTGIVMSGVFTSEPYVADDWNRSRGSKQIHYMDMRPNFIVNPETMLIIMTAQLNETIPDFEWSKGHSGMLLTEAQARKLEEVFAEYLNSMKDKVDGENLVIAGTEVNRFEKYFDAHGSHIGTIMPATQFADEQLPKIGSWSFYGKAMCKYTSKVIKNKEVEIAALRVGSEMGLVALLMKNEAEDRYEFLTTYPMHKGKSHRLQITEIQELKNQIEAVVHVEKEELSLAFFATDYFLNKDRYVIGNEIDVELAACAYSVCEGEKETVLDAETSAILRKDMGLEEEYDEEGNPKPITLDNGDLVAFLPDYDEYPDDVSFASRVKSVKNVSLFGNKYVKATISIGHDPKETYIPLYFDKEMMKNVQKGTLLSGTFWLQGRMANNE